MSDERKKSGWVFWATVILLLVVLYVASFGPACWVTSWVGLDGRIVTVFYAPIIWHFLHDTMGAGQTIDSYSRLAARPDWRFIPEVQNLTVVGVEWKKAR